MFKFHLVPLNFSQILTFGSELLNLIFLTVGSQRLNLYKVSELNGFHYVVTCRPLTALSLVNKEHITTTFIWKKHFGGI